MTIIPNTASKPNPEPHCIAALHYNREGGGESTTLEAVEAREGGRGEPVAYTQHCATLTAMVRNLRRSSATHRTGS